MELNVQDWQNQELRVDAWDGNLKASEEFLFPPVSVVSSELGAHLWDWCNFTVVKLCWDCVAILTI